MEGQSSQAKNTPSTYNVGKDTRSNNLLAAKIIANTVKSTLGPKGMDKVLIDENNTITITNDGATILEQMVVDHPIAKMMIEVALVQEQEVGDGTTTAVVLAGELVRQAEQLIEQKVHPTHIIAGFSKASAIALELISGCAKKMTPDMLLPLAITAMTGKVAEQYSTHLAKVCVDAIQNTSDINSADDISIVTQDGKNPDSTRLIQGIVTDKLPIYAKGNITLQNQKILLLTCPIELRQTDIQARIQITSPQQIDDFLAREEKTLEQFVSKIKQSGATIVCTQKGVDDYAAHLLQKENITIIRRMRSDEMASLSRASGAKISHSLSDISSNNIGDVGSIQTEVIAGQAYTIFSNLPKKSTATIICYGSTKHISEEIARAVHDALGDILAVHKSEYFVGGGGACEFYLSQLLLKQSSSLVGKEQLAFEAFAQALQIIPKTICENAGIDTLDCITALRSANSAWVGVHVSKGTQNVLENTVIDPHAVKVKAIESATQVVTAILRIDDIVFCGTSDSKNDVV